MFHTNAGRFLWFDIRAVYAVTYIGTIGVGTNNVVYKFTFVCVWWSALIFIWKKFTNNKALFTLKKVNIEFNIKTVDTGEKTTLCSAEFHPYKFYKLFGFVMLKKAKVSQNQSTILFTGLLTNTSFVGIIQFHSSWTGTRVDHVDSSTRMTTSMIVGTLEFGWYEKIRSSILTILNYLIAIGNFHSLE